MYIMLTDVILQWYCLVSKYFIKPSINIVKIRNTSCKIIIPCYILHVLAEPPSTGLERFFFAFLSMSPITVCATKVVQNSTHFGRLTWCDCVPHIHIVCTWMHKALCGWENTTETAFACKCVFNCGYSSYRSTFIPILCAYSMFV